MAKKNESILNLLVVAPWWVSVVLSISAYIFLKYVLPSINMGNNVGVAFMKGLSQLAFVVALVLLIPAPISAYNSYRKKALLEKQKDVDAIKDLSWKEFEELVAEAYRQLGYSVTENMDAGPDGGIDLTLKNGKNVFLVQCKQWRSAKVGVKVVREMYGIMTDQHATGVIIVTSGMFTQEARTFAIGKSIDLVEGNQLVELIGKVKSTESSNSVKIHENKNPVCPECGSEMVLRTAKQGKFAGNQFWGCLSFPKCKKIVQIKDVAR